MTTGLVGHTGMYTVLLVFIAALPTSSHSRLLQLYLAPKLIKKNLDLDFIEVGPYAWQHGENCCNHSQWGPKQGPVANIRSFDHEISGTNSQSHGRLEDHVQQEPLIRWSSLHGPPIAYVLCYRQRAAANKALPGQFISVQ